MAFSLSFAVAPWAGTAVYARFGAAVVWTLVFLIGLVAAGIMLRVTSEEPAPRLRSAIPSEPVEQRREAVRQ